MNFAKLFLKWVLGIVFVLAGINHFLNPDFYLKIMPTYLCCHLFLVYLSGVFEIGLGALLLLPKFSRLAAWGLIALLIAIFPANIYMAMNTELFPEISSLLIWFRLPLQFLLIAWAYWLTKSLVKK